MFTARIDAQTGPRGRVEPDALYSRPDMSANPFDVYQPTALDGRTHAPGPSGTLPLTPEMLQSRPSGDLFGWSQNAGMGWTPSALGGREFLMLIHARRHPRAGRHADRARVSHRPLGSRPAGGGGRRGVEVARARSRSRPSCTDPCDGRSQGTPAMFDSLPFRNDAAIVFRRLIRSLPTRRGVLGVATCDKGLPAMMMALAASHDLPCVLVPGGVTLLPEHGEDAGRVQTIGVRFVHGEITLEEAADAGCRACASPGGGCQFLGTAATSQVVGEALGTVARPLGAGAVRPADLARHGAPVGARADGARATRGIRMRDILTDAAVRNAMVTHAAFGGSTNLLLHVPAIAHAAGLPRPTAATGRDVNRQVPRLVDALPNGPRNHPTVQVFLAGGVPEVMLHLRRAGLLETGALTVERRDARRAARRVGDVRAPRAPARSCCTNATASIRTT